MSIFIFLFFLTSCGSVDHYNSKDDSIQLDSCNTTVLLSKSNYPKYDFESVVINGIRLTDQKKNILKEWGVPIKVDVDDTSPDGEIFEVWYYYQNEIVVSKEEDFFIALSISDTASIIFPRELSIGNTISSLIDSLPEIERKNALKYGRLRLPLKYAGKASDEFLILKFDSLRNISGLIYDGLSD
jgi:hypothetical protein